MNKRIDISEKKARIKNYIIGKNVIASKFAFRGDSTYMENFITRFKMYLEGDSTYKLDQDEFRTFTKAFSISSLDLRKVDCKISVDGKRQWLASVVIQEMIDAGELLEIKSYSTKSHYAKMYVLDCDTVLFSEMFDNGTYSQLGGKVFDNVREELEMIDKDLNIYQHDTGKQAKLYTKTIDTAELFDTGAFIEPGLVIDFCSKSWKDWDEAYGIDDSVSIAL